MLTSGSPSLASGVRYNEEDSRSSVFYFFFILKEYRYCTEILSPSKGLAIFWLSAIEKVLFCSVYQRPQDKAASYCK
jgi:hypothetical protein